MKLNCNLHKPAVFWFLSRLALCLLFSCLLITTTHTTTAASGDDTIRGLVRISDRNITAFNNRNLTIVCSANLNHRAEMRGNRNFSSNARMVLTFMLIPRTRKFLHQMQSFLHCKDPGRIDCYTEFNFDIGCLEDQMDQNYIRRANTYSVEVACQLDDTDLCSREWIALHPNDCYDLGRVTIINGKINTTMGLIY